MSRPQNLLELIIEQTVKQNGDTVQRVDISPEDLKAALESGMTHEQVGIFFATLANQVLQPTLPTNPAAQAPVIPSVNPNKMAPHPSINDCVDDCLSKMIEKYYEDVKLVKQNAWKPTTKHRTFFRRLTEIIGDKSVKEVTRDDAKTVLKTLKQLPADNAKFRNLSVTEIIAMNQSGSGVGLSEKTINDHLELYNRFFKWVKTELQLIVGSPFEQLRIIPNIKEKQNQKRNSFTSDELTKIFSTPLFTKGEYDAPYKFWAPLIALYTGARNAEIAALRKSDIRQFADIWVIDFNENFGDKRLKSVNSIRKTPIHPHLVELGFLSFVGSCSDGDRLFSELSKWTEKEGYARPIGDWFNGNYLPKLRIHDKRKKVFYSFRHTLTSALDRAGVSDTLTEQICGREAQNKTLGRSVYTDDATAERLLNEIIKVDFRKELQGVKWIGWPIDTSNPG